MTYIGVSANQRSLFGSPCNKESGILGSVSRQPFYGHLHMPQQFHMDSVELEPLQDLPINCTSRADREGSGN